MKQVIIKHINDGSLVINHYGKPDSQERMTMFGIHAANMLSALKEMNPELEREQIIKMLHFIVDCAIEIAEKAEEIKDESSD